MFSCLYELKDLFTPYNCGTWFFVLIYQINSLELLEGDLNIVNIFIAFWDIFDIYCSKVVELPSFPSLSHWLFAFENLLSTMEGPDLYFGEC